MTTMPPTGDGTSSAKSTASGGGLVSVNVNDAEIDYDPTVKAYVGTSQMQAGGSIGSAYGRLRNEAWAGRAD